MNRIIIYLLLIATSLQIQAQEITINASAGVLGQQYKLKQGDNSLKTGGSIGVGYTFFLNDNWGIISGLNIGVYRNKAHLSPNYKHSRFMVDNKGSAFEYRVKVNNYSEKSSFTAVSIPLMFQYKTKGKIKYYIGAGGKIFFPQKQKITVLENDLVLSGYYPNMDLEIINLPQHGFGTLKNTLKTEDIPLKTSFVLSVETGVRFKVGKKHHLYTGVYIDYGINDMREHAFKKKSIVSYSPKGIDKAVTKGVLSTVEINEKVNLFSFGIQLKYAFEIINKAPKKEEAVKKEPVKQVKELEKQQEEPKKIIFKAKEPEKITVKEEIVTSIKPFERKQIENPVTFSGEIGETNLTKEKKEELNKIAILLNKYKTLKINIIGHTCNIGTKSINLLIGKKRAIAVFDYLENNGVSKQRMYIISEGEEKPLYPNTSDENRRKNRRVELIIKE